MTMRGLPLVVVPLVVVPRPEVVVPLPRLVGGVVVVERPVILKASASTEAKRLRIRQLLIKIFFFIINPFFGQ
jgi:hypothetical protein